MCHSFIKQFNEPEATATTSSAVIPPLPYLPPEGDDEVESSFSPLTQQSGLSELALPPSQPHSQRTTTSTDNSALPRTSSVTQVIPGNVRVDAFCDNLNTLVKYAITKQSKSDEPAKDPVERGVDSFLTYVKDTLMICQPNIRAELQNDINRVVFQAQTRNNSAKKAQKSTSSTSHEHSFLGGDEN